MVLVFVIAAAGAAFAFAPRSADAPAAVPVAALDPAPSGTGQQTAVLAGGCFWGVQAVFEHVRGVSRVVAGYTGGARPNPSYEDVSTETTGHAESVQITYDPAKVSYGTLLRVYFSVAHDPTQLNRQGPDIGDNCRSAIFYFDDEQRQTVEMVMMDVAPQYDKPIVTQLAPAGPFYAAEPHHQKYTERTGQGMCHVPYVPLEK
jgi:peptide-methionine (S)-S-oxide reductase